MIDLQKKSEKGAALLIRTKRVDVFHMKQEEFAERFGVTLSTLRNWEQGNSEPPEYFLRYLAVEEANLKKDNLTPIQSERLTAENEISPANKLLHNMVYDEMMKSGDQAAVYELAMSMIAEGGVLDNMQMLHPYFNRYDTTNIASLSQVVLLQRIDEKLSQILSKLSTQ